MTTEELEQHAKQNHERKVAAMTADGWEFLTGEARAKANKVCGIPDNDYIDAAIKIGRKTVFYRDHGVWTLYVVSDAGHAGGIVQHKGYTGLPSLHDCRYALALAYGQFNEHGTVNPDERYTER